MDYVAEASDAEIADLIDSAKKLARKWADIGAECDECNRFPLESVADYRASGLVGMVVPKQFGGKGVDIWTAGQVSRELARGEPSLGLAYNMHTGVVGIIRSSAGIGDEVRARTLRKIAQEGAIICGAFSEQRAGLTGLADTIAIPQAGGGWRISGRKNWATLVEAADLVAVNATITDADGTLPADQQEHLKRESLFILPVKAENIVIERTWNTMGMRATGSQTLAFNGAHAPPESFGGNFRVSSTGQGEWNAITFGAVYQGLAEKAFAETCEIVKRKQLGATALASNTVLKDVGSVQHALGRLYMLIQASARTLEFTARSVVNNSSPDWSHLVRRAHLDLAKVQATEMAVTVTDVCMRLIGGAAFRKGHNVERLFRDARAGLIQPLGADQLYDILGKSELGSLK